MLCEGLIFIRIKVKGSLGYKTATMWMEISILSTIQCICECLWALSLSGDVLESLSEALDCHNSPCVAESLVPVVFSHNKHRYIPLFLWWINP